MIVRMRYSDGTIEDVETTVPADIAEDMRESTLAWLEFLMVYTRDEMVAIGLLPPPS